MNTFKMILFSFILTAMTPTVFAVANPSYEDVKVAIDNTLAKVEEANIALNNGVDNEAVVEMVTDARQLQKDIANNVLDVKRNQASNVLKQARMALQKNELQPAKESLADALNRYKEIKQLYASAH
jgi:membrane-bound ClpP family serine protease